MSEIRPQARRLAAGAATEELLLLWVDGDRSRSNGEERARIYDITYFYIGLSHVGILDLQISKYWFWFLRWPAVWVRIDWQSIIGRFLDSWSFQNSSFIGRVHSGATVAYNEVKFSLRWALSLTHSALVATLMNASICDIINEYVLTCPRNHFLVYSG